VFALQTLQLSEYEKRRPPAFPLIATRFWLQGRAAEERLPHASITERGVFKPGRIAAQFRPDKSLRSRLKGMSKRDLHEKKSRP
jgi:hypothetical protein